MRKKNVADLFNSKGYLFTLILPLKVLTISKDYDHHCIHIYS